MPKNGSSEPVERAGGTELDAAEPLPGVNRTAAAKPIRAAPQPVELEVLAVAERVVPRQLRAADEAKAGRIGRRRCDPERSVVVVEQVVVALVELVAVVHPHGGPERREHDLEQAARHPQRAACDDARGRVRRGLVDAPALVAGIGVAIGCGRCRRAREGDRHREPRSCRHRHPGMSLHRMCRRGATATPASDHTRQMPITRGSPVAGSCARCT